MKYTVVIKYQAEAEVEVSAANADAAEEDALALLEFSTEGSIVSYDVVETIPEEEDEDNYDYDDDLDDLNVWPDDDYEDEEDD